MENILTLSVSNEIINEKIQEDITKVKNLILATKLKIEDAIMAFWSPSFNSKSSDYDTGSYAKPQPSNNPDDYDEKDEKILAIKRQLVEKQQKQNELRDEMKKSLKKMNYHKYHMKLHAGYAVSSGEKISEIEDELKELNKLLKKLEKSTKSGVKLKKEIDELKKMVGEEDDDEYDEDE